MVHDLYILMITAGVVSLLFKLLKQPVVLGYIVAGILVGPHLFGENLVNPENVEAWGNIGVLFVLFCIGLEFRLKNLFASGKVALVGAATIIIGMLVLGYGVGRFALLDNMNSLFLAAMLCMSSTTIVMKAIDEAGLSKARFVKGATSILIFEDIVAVVLLVLLSSIAVKNSFEGVELLKKIGVLAITLVVWFIVGILVIPTLLRKVRPCLNDETLIILALGLCLGMVLTAEEAGFSSALGAFVMGMVLAETLEAHRIEHLMEPLKNVFAAIFFVSVGMMIDPAVIGEYWGTILVIALLAMAGIMTFITIGALLAGKSLDTAVHTGFSLAQLGEFGFILASLGVSLGVMRGFIYPVIIATSVLTTFATPFMIKAADPASLWLHRNLPAKILNRLNTSDDESGTESSAEKSEWKKFLTAYATRIVLYSIILIAVLIGSHSFLENLLAKVMAGLSPALIKWTGVIVTLVVMAPFLYGLAVQRGSLQAHVKKLLQEKDSNKWPLLSLMVLRLLIAVSFILVFISSKFDLTWWMVLLIVAATLTLLRILPRYIKMSGLEDRFISNLNARETEQRRNAPVTTTIQEKLSGYDVHLDAFYLSPDSSYVGHKLRDIPFRSTTGVNIVKIVRGARSILIPNGDEHVYPYDRLLAVGTSSQIADFAKLMEHEVVDPENLRLQASGDDQDFAVEVIPVSEGSFLRDKALKDLSMRESGCMVLSVLRDNEFITNPKADFRFKDGDTVWIAGEKESCEFFK